MTALKRGKIYINGRLVGFHNNPIELCDSLIDKRRKAQITHTIGIAYHEDTNELYINTDSGRVVRPLIVVERGKLKLTEDHVKQVEKGDLKWHELVEKGIIEYLDAEEEENALIALKEEEITNKHTHMELEPFTNLSVITSMIPYIEHDMAGKALHGAKMFKQGIGIQAINYNLRMDTEMHLLYYPQINLVKTRTAELLHMDARPDSQNFVVAILPYYGFTIQDAIVLNKGAVERGLGRSSYFRGYESEEQHYPGGQTDKLQIPKEDAIGFMGEEAYKNLDEEGIIDLESFVDEKSVIIGKTSPPRFLEEINEFGVAEEKRTDSSTISRKGKVGYVDKILITEGPNATKLLKVKVRTRMVPEVGDKFSSKHGQKGIVGAIIPEEDMPFSESGLKPDLILDPHSLPSRMTIGHLLETLAGKAACIKGQAIDGTPFSGTKEDELAKILKSNGFRSDGKEMFYDGLSGERIKGEIFTGVVSYRRLYHLVAHKIQARSRGAVQILTRQPTEGKEKEGGLRFGEMEGETLVGHGAAMLLQEKLINESDKVIELVCEKCGTIAINDQIRNKRYCQICKSTKVHPVEMAYSFKLLLDEMKALGLLVKMNIGDKA